MKNLPLLLALLLFIRISGFSQELKPEVQSNDSLTVKKLDEVVINAMRIKVPLKQIPAAISVVSGSQLGSMNKTIAADEIFRLTPGVKVENGTDGSRVHVYIRGQGILTESGFRGIGVYLDGISINDPGGYAPDLYDIDWETVKHVEVVKGLAASTYGAGATGGVINILTKDGGKKPVSSSVLFSAGSYGFWKVLGQVDGTKDNISYRITYSHTQGHGYREHQSFMSDNFSEKLTWTPTPKWRITQMLNYVSYFNQNSEGINWGRYDTVGPRAANTDAVPYNEFHKTRRLTGSVIANYEIAGNQNIQVKGYLRFNNYRETSNNGDDYKPFTSQGFSAQYNFNAGKENLYNHLSIGGDYVGQNMTEHLFAVPDGAHINKYRVDSYWSEECFDLNNILINQVVNQQGAGFFLMDKLDIAKKLYVVLNARYDLVYNKLENNLPMSDSLSQAGKRNFEKPSFRIGIAYDACKFANIYGSFGTGYQVPSNDELYNNPYAYGGFNSVIKPSTSVGGELGIRGTVNEKLYYDVTAFNVNTTDEFYRFSVPGRGNNTAFYGNMGQSLRWGIETFLSWNPVDIIRLQAAYTYSDFKYTSPDSVNGNRIPQSPQHLLTAELAFDLMKNLTLMLNSQIQSKYCIQVDDSIYNNYHENGVLRSSWVNGSQIFSAGLDYRWQLGNWNGTLNFYCKNLLDEQYFGFTEPNNGPDYNSYQPAPGREFFVTLRIRM